MSKTQDVIDLIDRIKVSSKLEHRCLLDETCPLNSKLFKKELTKIVGE